MSFNAKHILSSIEEALKKAGDCIAKWQGKVSVQKKKDKSPVTEADNEANQIIFGILHKACPDYGYLSEEGLSEGTTKDFVFAVDPLDGTKEYIQGRQDFAVSIGLLKNGVPVAGGVYVVRWNKLYLGSLEHGVTCNGESITLPQKDCKKIAVSRTETRNGVIARYPLIQNRAFPMGSIAVKFTLLLENRVQGYVSFYPKGIWDIAGGHALVEAAGGKVLNFSGQAIRYDLSQKLCHDGVVAGSKTVIPFLLKAVQEPA